MVFNSLDFLIFIVITLLLWPIIRRNDNTRWVGLTLLSLFFYGWWDWRFLFLILGSGFIDYICGFCIFKYDKYKKGFFLLSVFANISSLFIFKYSDFFVEIINDANLIIGRDFFNLNHDFTSGIILPVGISFYTFQSLSYSIDTYRGRLSPTKNIFHFFSFLTFFPQLVAGPIVRAKDFLTQLKKYRVVSSLEKWNAIKMFSFGLFQKVVIADNLSFFIDSGFENKSSFDGQLYWIFISVAFTFQIYCDFSGYSLMARGIAKWMGFHFKMNFNHPYLSLGFKSFWTKWHISLSTWFRDYVYIPIGGSHKGKILGFFALCVTMILSGIWHGANYTFLAWAFIHVLFLQFERLTKWQYLVQPKLLVILITFIVINFSWIFFRANSINQANEIVIKIFTFSNFDIGFIGYYFDQLIFLFIAILIESSIYLKSITPILRRFYKKNNVDFYLVIISILCAFYLRGEGQQFIYFQF